VAVGAWRHDGWLLRLAAATVHLHFGADGRGGICNASVAWPRGPDVRPHVLSAPSCTATPGHSHLRPHERHDDDIRSPPALARTEDGSIALFVAGGWSNSSDFEGGTSTDGLSPTTPDSIEGPTIVAVGEVVSETRLDLARPCPCRGVWSGHCCTAYGNSHSIEADAIKITGQG
jgi:hypothetical protein